MSFEKIILQHDTRGISELSKFLVPDFCINAAKLTLENIGTVFITTGFYIKKSKAIETDGPLGAIAIGNALEKLGFDIMEIVKRMAMNFIDLIINCI